MSDDDTQAADDHLRARLRDLDDLAYFRQRKEIAEVAGIGVGELDKIRAIERKVAAEAAKRAADAAAEKAKCAAEAGKRAPSEALWPTTVDGAQLASGIEAALRRFVVLAAHAYVLVTLWVIGTHAFAKRAIYPLLLARSPQPICGKSTLLDCLERLVARAFVAGNASLATLFRSAASGPTQLLDELDRWLARDPEVIGFLCAGWQSGRPFVRCNPETLELQEFPCYGPKALALIGDVSDEALRSRCIAIEMRRALPGERPERFRAARPYPELSELRSMAARWARDHASQIGAYMVADDDLPGLNSRGADNAEALLSVAEAIGGEWPARCRAALLGAPRDESQNLEVMLLADLADLVAKLPEDTEAIATQQVLDYLLAQDDRPWPTCRKGKPIEANWLRRRLAPYGARPGRHYISGMQHRAYLLAPIREAIRLYAPPCVADPADPSEEVSQASCRLGNGSGDAVSAPESPGARHQDGQDASNGGGQKTGERTSQESGDPLGEIF